MGSDNGNTGECHKQHVAELAIVVTVILMYLFRNLSVQCNPPAKMEICNS